MIDDNFQCGFPFGTESLAVFLNCAKMVLVRRKKGKEDLVKIELCAGLNCMSRP